MSPQPLMLGLNGALHIREENLARRPQACRILYISDIHLRPARSERLIRQVVDAAHTSRAHALLLGGDLLDRRSELPRLQGLVRQLADIAPVFAVGGNHDQSVGLDHVRNAVTAGGGTWIHDAAARFAHGSRAIVLAGPATLHLPRGDVHILCAHNPRIWKSARHRGFDLVLAGHLHGCQIVAFQFAERLFPGALFYPYCCLRRQSGTARLLVSRGISDLVPIRWRCPREVLLCHV